MIKTHRQRQRDRETERQRDRKTERQRDRETIPFGKLKRRVCSGEM